MTKPNFLALEPDPELIASMISERDDEVYIRSPFEVTFDELVEFIGKAKPILDAALNHDDNTPSRLQTQVAIVWVKTMWAGLMSDYQQANDEIEGGETPTGATE